MAMEDRYQEAERMFQCLSCLSACDDKIIICENLTKQFERLGDYKNSEERLKQCNKIIQKTKEAQMDVAYKRAVKHMKQAKTSQEYEIAEMEFEKLTDYKDSYKLMQKCCSTKKSINKYLFLRAKIISGLFLLIVAILILLQVPFGKYYSANVLMKVKLYEQAAVKYEDLEDYKDSKVRYNECEYQYGLRCMSKDQYSKALEAFQQADSRKDSDALAVKMQKEVLANAKPGKKIKIGDASWIVLWKQEDQVLLMKKTEIDHVTYCSLVSEVSWEISDVRAFLNTTYMEGAFSAEEIENIASYHGIGPDSSYSSEDKMMLLSSKEVQYIMEQLKKDSEETSIYMKKEISAIKKNLLEGSSNQWLRTPAFSSGNEMFMNADWTVMEKGYDPNSNEFGVSPVFWYQLQ